MIGAGRDERARRDDGLLADLHAVHHDRAHADEAAAPDVAAVQSDVVPDRHFVFEDGGVRPVGDVDDRPVLHVRAVADADIENVAPDDGVEPDGRLRADVNVADYLRALFDEGRRVDLRARPTEWSNHLPSPSPFITNYNETPCGKRRYG